MNKTFIETREFTEWVKEYLSDVDLSGLQRVLSNDPETGAVFPGCGGLRKIRVANTKRGKGKRGGARVIYLHVAEADIIYLFDIYNKNDQDDLTADQKRFLKGLADEYKRAAILTGAVFKRGKP